MSNFDRVANVVIEQEQRFQNALRTDGVDYAGPIPVVPWDAGWKLILRTSIWHAIDGDRLPAPVALLVCDAATMLGIVWARGAVSETYFAIFGIDFLGYARAVESLRADFGSVKEEFLRRYQVSVLVALFQSPLWRDSHAPLDARLRETLSVALSWWDTEGHSE